MNYIRVKMIIASPFCVGKWFFKKIPQEDPGDLCCVFYQGIT